MADDQVWWTHWLQYSSRTDIGMRRTNNQDSRCCHPAASHRLWRSKGHMFVVADGMGAHAAGELASQIAVDSIPQAYLKKSDEHPWDALRNAIFQTHLQIKRQGNEDEAFRDMGTTVDALLLLPEGAVVAHVGDSRVYRLRKGIYEQLTFDHSLLWEVKRSGRIPEDRIPAYIPKNVITRSLGPTENLVVDVEGPLPLEVGDTFLLCSDGLSGQIEDDEMAQILQLLSPDEATETLVNLTNLRGGPDNITVTVAKITAIPSADEEKSDPVLEKRPRPTTLALSLLVFALVALIFSFTWIVSGQESKAVPIITVILSILFAGGFLFAAHKSIFPVSYQRPLVPPLGRAPYSTASAIPNPSFAAKLTDIKRQLIEAVDKQGILADHSGFQPWETQLKHAQETGNFGEVIRCDARIINFLMAEIKKMSTDQTQGDG
ncbi:MAG: protein phosphatase 2C domain-containing protein [Planctomycetia bacterium]|nr:protein phosphatase 2C domain-containing protein [Planctomycetia bacterium]